MVALDIIKHSNSHLINADEPKVAVFVGGTSGIGHLTLTELVGSGAKTRVYLIGRPSAKALMECRISHFKTVNPNAEIIWLEGEISLLADVRRLCSKIKSKESTLDLLFMSAGLLAFAGRKETSEGLDTSQSLQYFSRMAFITNLLPLLRSSNNGGRVVSVLGGGMEPANIDAEDLELRKHGAYGAVKLQVHLIAMNSLMMEKMAEEEPMITFIHSFPGRVNTGNVMADVSPYSPLAWLLRLLVQPLIQLTGFSNKESGQRNLFISTSAMYGGRGVTTELPQAINSKGETGSGLFLVSPQCDAGLSKSPLDQLRQTAQGQVWTYTQKAMEPLL